VHPCFVRRASALPPVARHAAGDDVFPVLAAAVSNRYDVIEGQLARRQRVAAVLARVIVAGVDVRTRKRHVVEPAFNLDVTKKANHGGELDAERHRSNLPVINRDHLYFSLAKQSDSLLPVNDL
jgi:hypothetical protein